MKADKKKKQKNSSTKRREDRIPFTKNHPQYETHWQKVRLDSSAKVPALSQLPPSIHQNKEKHQKCILLQFKPFTCFDELYTVNWDVTYSEFLETTKHVQYIENIEELQTEKDRNNENDGNDENNVENADDEGYDDCNEVDDTDSDVD